MNEIENQQTNLSIEEAKAIGIGETANGSISERKLRELLRELSIERATSELASAAWNSRTARAIRKSLPTIISVLLVPLLAHAQFGGGAATSLRGSLQTTNNDLLDFLQNDVATLCMIVGGIFAAVTHIFNGGQGTKFFLSIFGCGVIAMAFTTVLALARGLATSVGH